VRAFLARSAPQPLLGAATLSAAIGLAAATWLLIPLPVALDHGDVATILLGRVLLAAYVLTNHYPIHVSADMQVCVGSVPALLIAALLPVPQAAIVFLLGKGIGYTLTLAGIAGLIVAIGVTADSFVVFFERLRDEVREGNTLRSSVERGWVRARRTIISADIVSLIASAILYIVAIGDVRGFAFTLGLSTIIDLVVVFLFTKPLITLLGRTKFFGDGHRLSGLDAGHLGVERLRTGTAMIRRGSPRQGGAT